MRAKRNPDAAGRAVPGPDAAGAPVPGPDAARLAALGLPADAGVTQIRAARERLATFLDSAPDDLSEWAQAQLAEADALLGDIADPPAPGASKSGDPGPRRPQRADDDGTYVDVAALDADTPSDPPATHAPIDAGLRPAASAPQTPRRPRALLPLLAAAVVLGVVWSVYTLNDTSAALPANHPTATANPTAVASATSAAPLDEAKIAALKAKVAADPTDVVSLRAIAEEYFRVSQFGDAATWQAKVVELKPTDVDSRLILGVAYFDDNQFDNAKAQWLKAAELDPTSPDPHYNLGFLYLSLDPPDPAAAEAAWRKVIALAPGSEIADTVESHIQSLDASPSPTPTPSK